MRNFAKNPAGPETIPNRARPQSAKSTRAIMSLLFASVAVAACGDNQDSDASTTEASTKNAGTASLSPQSLRAKSQTQRAAQTSTASQSRTSESGTGSATTAVNTAAAPASDFRLAGYDTLFFSDEFNAQQLDRSKWCTRFVWGGGPELQIPDAECTKFPGQGTLDWANEDEQQRYRDINSQGEPLHVLGKGTLKLRATKTGRNDYLAYEAAMLNSKMTFKPEGNTSYYITTRMKLPNVLGTWPSIWLAPSLNKDGVSQWPPEIDIFEGPLNNAPETEYTLHQHSQVRGQQTSTGKYDWVYADENFDTTWGYYTSPDRTLRDVWLEIAAEWTVNGVCFFIDGFKTGCENYRWVANDGAPGHPANLILNLAIGGPWAGRGGIAADKFPTQLEVDYVRIYRKN